MAEELFYFLSKENTYLRLDCITFLGMELNVHAEEQSTQNQQRLKIAENTHDVNALLKPLIILMQCAGGNICRPVSSKYGRLWWCMTQTYCLLCTIIVQLLLVKSFFMFDQFEVFDSSLLIRITYCSGFLMHAVNMVNTYINYKKVLPFLERLSNAAAGSLPTGHVAYYLTRFVVAGFVFTWFAANVIMCVLVMQPDISTVLIHSARPWDDNYANVRITIITSNIIYIPAILSYMSCAYFFMICSWILWKAFKTVHADMERMHKHGDITNELNTLKQQHQTLRELTDILDDICAGFTFGSICVCVVDACLLAYTFLRSDEASTLYSSYAICLMILSGMVTVHVGAISLNHWVSVFPVNTPR